MEVWLRDGGGRVAILDAANSTVDRRAHIYSRCESLGLRTLFIESICEDEEVVRRNICQVKKIFIFLIAWIFNLYWIIHLLMGLSVCPICLVFWIAVEDLDRRAHSKVHRLIIFLPHPCLVDTLNLESCNLVLYIMCTDKIRFDIYLIGKRNSRLKF